MDDLISIIVPIYKIEDYIEKCARSILAQTYRNLEIILVNDESPDRCGEICDQLAKDDSRIKVLHKVNGGLSDARNAGIKIATGKYIAFIDGDDFIHTDYIQKLYDAVLEEDSDVAVCSFSLVKGDQIVKDEIVSENKSRIMGHDLLERVLTDTGYKYVVAWNKLYKRELFQKHQFAKGKLYEDEYINFGLFWDIKKVALIPDSLYFYIQRSGSIQGSNMTWDKLLTKQEIHHKRIDFYSEKKDEMLLKRSKQMYCNWLVSISYQNRELLDEKKLRLLQNEFRKYSKDVQASKGEKVQNVIARMNLKFAGTIKAKYKG